MMSRGRGVRFWLALEGLALLVLYAIALAPLLAAVRSFLREGRILPVQELAMVAFAGLLTLAFAVHVLCRTSLAPAVHAVIWRDMARRMATEVASSMYARGGHLHSWTHPAPGAVAISGNHLLLCDRSTDFSVQNLPFEALRTLSRARKPAGRASLIVPYSLPHSGRSGLTHIGFESVEGMQGWCVLIAASHPAIVPTDLFEAQG